MIIIQELRERYEDLQYQSGVQREDLNGYRHDINVLVDVIAGARESGNWDVSTGVLRNNWDVTL